MPGSSKCETSQQHFTWRRCRLDVKILISLALVVHTAQASQPVVKIDIAPVGPDNAQNVTCIASGKESIGMSWSFALSSVSSRIMEKNSSTSNGFEIETRSTRFINSSFKDVLSKGQCSLRTEEQSLLCEIDITCRAWYNSSHNGTEALAKSSINTEWYLPVPPKISIGSKSSRHCQLKWDPVSSRHIPGKEVVIVVQAHGGGQLFGRTKLPGYFTTYTFPNLAPYSVYNVSMYLVLAHKESIWKSPVIYYAFRTSALEPRTSPSFLQNLPSGPNNILASWQKTGLPHRNGKLTSVIIDVKLLQYGGKAIGDIGMAPYAFSTGKISAKNNVQDLRGLSPWCTYELTIKACNEEGMCDYSGSKTIAKTREGEPTSPPANVTWLSISSNELKIGYMAPSFKDSHGEIIGYRYSVRSIRGDKPMSYRPKRDTTSSQLTRTFSNLQPYTFYNISVAAYTSAGTGPFSAPLNIKTEEGVPSVPLYTRLVRVPPKETCLLLWDAPSRENGVIRNYVVKTFCNNKSVEAIEIPVDYFNLDSELSCKASSCSSFQVLAKTTVEGMPSPMLYPRNINSNLPEYIAPVRKTKTESYDIFALIAIGCLVFFITVMLIAAFCVYKRRYTNKLVRRHILMHSIPSPLGLKDVGISDVVRSQADLYEPKETDPLTATPNSPDDIRHDDHSHKTILVEDFPAYMKEKMQDDHPFKYEYKRELKSGKCYSWDVADRPENKPKNRYTNIAAYDHSRVILRSDSGKRRHDSDYFNASHIEGYCQDSKTKYIACHGPTESVVADFWRMVWQENVSVIVMLTNLEERGKTKCYQYWPSYGSMKSGQVTVTAMGQDITTDYKIRTFELAKMGARENRIIKQFHFLSWPDHGVPDHPTALLSLRRRVRMFYNNHAPMVIHCSAGVGRTGCFILVDAAMEKIEDTGTVDLFNYLQYLRTRRIDMVQTLSQYKFAHHVLLEYVTCGCTEVTASDFQKKFHLLKRGTGMQDEYEILKKTSENSRERGNLNRVFLQEGQRIAYVDAFFVDGYKQNDSFIVTAAPDQNDIARFWKIIVEHQCHTIITLHKLKENGSIHCQFWPSATEQISIGDQSVVLLAENREPDVIVRKFKILNSEEDCQIQQFHFLEWPENGVPSSRNNLLKLMSLVEKSQQNLGNGPILVQCSNGYGRSGSFIAVYNSTERLKTEQLIDVLQCVRVIRKSCPGAVENFEQYDFIYNMIGTYLEAFQTYSNFEHAGSLVQ